MLSKFALVASILTLSFPAAAQSRVDSRAGSRAADAARAGEIIESEAEAGRAIQFASFALAAPDMGLDLPARRIAALEDFREEFRELAPKAEAGSERARRKIDRLVMRAGDLLNGDQWGEVLHAVYNARDAKESRRRAIGLAVATADELVSRGLSSRLEWRANSPAVQASRQLGVTFQSIASWRRAVHGITPVGRSLDNLKTQGSALLRPGQFATESEERRIIRAVDREYQDWTDWGGTKKTRLYDFEKQGERWLGDVGADKNGRGGIKDLVERLRLQLKDALPRERFAINSVEIRVTDGQQSEYPDLHIDKRYLTATYVFGDGPTTVYFEGERGGRPIRRRAPARSAAVITARQREAATGIPATVHGAPPEIVGHRIFLQVIFRTLEPPENPESLRLKINRRIYDSAKKGESYLHFSREYWTDFSRPTAPDDLRVK